MAENGKWQFAFWIVTVFLVIIGGSVISNDRLRASEDQRIEGNFSCRLDAFQKDITELKVSIAETKSMVSSIKMFLERKRSE